MTLEEEAQKYVDTYPNLNGFSSMDMRTAYIMGAKAHMAVWHTEPPATDHFCLDETGRQVFWNKHWQKWQDMNGSLTEVKAWCQIPKFEED